MALTKRELEVWEQFLRAHAAITRQLDDELVEEHGLTLNEYDVLVQLDAAPAGRLRPTELADGVLLTRSGITRLLGRLERQKLIDREACSDDGRVSYACLTEAGRAKRREARRTHLRGVSALFSENLGTDDLEPLAGLFRRLASSAGTNSIE